MQQSKKLRKRFYFTTVTTLVLLAMSIAVTFAWYIYNTQKHTTNVHIVTGTNTRLLISTDYDLVGSSSTVLDVFNGYLEPVSTNKIDSGNGFQKVFGFEPGRENQSNLVATLFGKSEPSDYYKTKVFLRTSGDAMKIYISDIGFRDSDSDNPISTAIRIGLVSHEPGLNQPENGEYIFSINTDSNPQAEYNTATGQEGYVLDSSKTDGTTVPFTPYTPANYCNYNKNSGEITLNDNSLSLGSIAAANGQEFSEAIQIDIYIWLEGCDQDCTSNLNSTTLENLAISFAGKTS